MLYIASVENSFEQTTSDNIWKYVSLKGQAFKQVLKRLGLQLKVNLGGKLKV